MKNSDSHIYLYAKNWYEKNDVINDLKMLYSERNGIDPECLSTNDVIICLTNLTLKHIKLPEHFKEFLSDISPDNVWRVWRFDKEPYDYWKAVISKCLSVLSLTEISEIENGIDEPDYTLLPKSKE